MIHKRLLSLILFFSCFCIGISSLKAKKISMKMATVAPRNTPWGLHQSRLKKLYFPAKKYKIKLYYSGALGGEKTIIRRCRQGRIEAVGVTQASLSPTVPELSVMELPFLFKSEKEADYILDVVMNKEFRELLEKRGFVLWFYPENGFRNIATTEIPFKKIGDLKGRKMRSQENRIYIDFYQALESSPIPIAVPEVLSALQTGVIDGFDQTPLFTFTSAWFEGIKHYTKTNHIYQPTAFIFSKKFWDKGMPKDLQKTVLRTEKKESNWSRKTVRKLKKRLLKELQKSGVKIYELDPKVRQQMSKRTFTVHQKFREDWGPKVASMLDKINSSLKEYRKKK